MFKPVEHKIFQIPWMPGNFAGFTLYPWIYVKDTKDKELIDHEMIHLKQQEPFYRIFGPLGGIIWRALYFLILPIWWNPFRFNWELQAFVEGSKWDAEFSKKWIRKYYWLWGHK